MKILTRYPFTKQQKLLSINDTLLWHAATGLHELNFYIAAYESGDFGPADAQRKSDGERRNMTREQYYQKMLKDREWAEGFIIDIIGRMKEERCKDEVLTN